MSHAGLVGFLLLGACTGQPSAGPLVTLAPVVVLTKVAGLAATEIAAASGSWTGNLFRVHPVAEDEAWVSYGLSLIHVQGTRTSAGDALSRGLPVQTDPCFAPSIHELRATASGELVLTLADGGSPHFTGGCRDRLPGDDAYAWRGERWVPVPTPAWAVTSSRQLFAEARVGAKRVRLLGPSVGPESDGFSTPAESEYLGACFLPASRSTLAGWDAPLLAALPADLCVEGARFGGSTRDALYLGRTRDGRTWLERQTPDVPPRRTLVDVPASCTVRTVPHVVLSELDRGTLELDVHCNDTPNDDQTWSARRLRYEYTLDGSAWRVAPLPPVEIGEAQGPFELGPSFRLTEAKPPGVAHGATELLPAVTQVRAYGTELALAERDGHVFLLGPRAKSEPIVLDGEHSGPAGQFLAAPSSVSGACRNGLRILARLPALDTVESTLAGKRTALVELAHTHAELARGEEPFVEFRLGDDAWLARAWPAPEDGGADEATTRAVTAGAKAAGLAFASSCLFAPPPGEGRAYRIAAGQIQPASPGR